MNTLEGYILNLIKKSNSDLKQITSDYNEKKITFFDFRILQEKTFAERNILYRILTAHDNPQSIYSILNNKKNEQHSIKKK